MKTLTPTEWGKTGPDHWTGGKIGDDRYTLQQQRFLQESDEKPIGSFVVTIWRPHPTHYLAPHVSEKHECPLLAETRQARLVVTPSGHKRWIKKRGSNK